MDRMRKIEVELERMNSPYEFNPETGILRLSMNPNNIERFLEVYPLPRNTLTLPSPERPTFENVRNIEPMPVSDGRYSFTYNPSS